MPVNWCLYTTFLFRTRISCLVTAAYKVLDNDGVTAVGLLDVHRDVALNTTFRVITAIDILQDTTGNSQINVIMDMGVIGAAMNIFNGITGTCGYDNINMTYITRIACTIKSGNPQRTVTRSLFRNNRSRITTATLGVTATEYLTYFTTSAFYSGSTDDDSAFILIPVAILFFDGSAAVTTAKTVTDVVASFYQDICFRNNS